MARSCPCIRPPVFVTPKVSTCTTTPSLSGSRSNSNKMMNPHSQFQNCMQYFENMFLASVSHERLFRFVPESQHRPWQGGIKDRELPMQQIFPRPSSEQREGYYTIWHHWRCWSCLNDTEDKVGLPWRLQFLVLHSEIFFLLRKVVLPRLNKIHLLLKDLYLLNQMVNENKNTLHGDGRLFASSFKNRQ